MTTDPHELLAAYALDALDDAERAEFEAHLATCDSCPAELADLAEVVGGLADTTSVAAPPNVRAQVLAQIGEIEQVPAVPSSAARHRTDPTGRVVDLAERRRRKLSVANMLTAAAAAVLLLVGAIAISGLRGDVDSDYDDVASASDAVVAELAAVAELQGDGGTVEVAYSAELDRVALRGDDVADLDPGLRYALWAIADETPIPAGLFATDGGSIDEAVDLADVDAQAWAITVEPETGSDAPTGNILYSTDT